MFISLAELSSGNRLSAHAKLPSSDNPDGSRTQPVAVAGSKNATGHPASERNTADRDSTKTSPTTGKSQAALPTTTDRAETLVVGSTDATEGAWAAITWAEGRLLQSAAGSAVAQ
jgi:hypothetical protein